MRLAASRAGPVLVAVLLGVSRAGPVALAVLEAPVSAETAIGAVLPLISVSKMERQYSSALSSVSLLLVAEKENILYHLILTCSILIMRLLSIFF